ncbi:MAG: hypothetical protein ACRDAM_05585, partial [Casimicrobium sp.]
EFLKSAHHWLILHGRYTCVARTPKCGECVVFEECEYSGRLKIRASIPSPLAGEGAAKRRERGIA